ncbi:ATP-grasp domain-containing protein [Microbacterium alcoholitolerans]|uniref:ATP-grasp domain-containing protein n=1 Tax=unclassified Microbacterium TaxID=2609290 RepID=UPI003D167CDF
MKSLTLLLSSAGRRPYLVEWFQHAFQLNGVSGRVVVVDSDRHAASRDAADKFLVAPPVVNSGYEPWLANVLLGEDVDLAVSVNDFELSRWSKLRADFPRVDRLLRLEADTHRVIEDKLLMASALLEHGVRVPRTQTASSALNGLDRAGTEFVTKGRFGSASRGLRMVTADTLHEMIHDALREVTDASGRPVSMSALDRFESLVVQDRVQGEEFGLDVVSDLDGKHAATLARRKIAMRAGETDRAVSVDAAQFETLGQRISTAIPHRGSIDVDVLVDVDGEAWVIDVNPRFGGGYPFSHLAGAHTPAAYVAWLAGVVPKQAWLESEPGIISSKFVGVARTV